MGATACPGRHRRRDASKWERRTKLPSKRYERLLRARQPSPGRGRFVRRADVDRRDFLNAPSSPWGVHRPEPRLAGRHGRGRDRASRPGRRAQVEAIRRTFGIFQEMDVMRGGGHARRQLANYVTTVVTPLLRENTPPPPPAGHCSRPAPSSSTSSAGWPTTTANTPSPSSTSSKPCASPRKHDDRTRRTHPRRPVRSGHPHRPPRSGPTTRRGPSRTAKPTAPHASPTSGRSRPERKQPSETPPPPRGL